VSSFRTRCSPPPTRAKGDRDTPKSAWSQQPNDVSSGVPPSELWGVATRDASKPRRKRGDKARARRRAKQAAKRMGVTLKSYLRGTFQKRKKEKSK
jgi:hypothetical protein